MVDMVSKPEFWYLLETQWNHVNGVKLWKSYIPSNIILITEKHSSSSEQEGPLAYSFIYITEP